MKLFQKINEKKVRPLNLNNPLYNYPLVKQAKKKLPSEL